MVRIANNAKIPTFSQSGSEEVRYGFMMSQSQADFMPVGYFHAKAIAKIFNGAKPRELEMEFEEPSKIAINLKTAQIIGFAPPDDVLLSADEIFKAIEVPPSE